MSIWQLFLIKTIYSLPPHTCLVPLVQGFSVIIFCSWGLRRWSCVVCNSIRDSYFYRRHTSWKNIFLIQHIPPSLYRNLTSQTVPSLLLLGLHTRKKPQKGKKGKVHSGRGHKDPEGEEQRYSSTPSSPLLLERGRWLTPCPYCSIPRKDLVPIVQEAGWAPGQVWMGAEKSCPHQHLIPEPSSP